MTTISMTRLSAAYGVELWRLIADGVEQFVVRSGARSARSVSSRTSAEALFFHRIMQGRIARAH